MGLVCKVKPGGTVEINGIRFVVNRRVELRLLDYVETMRVDGRDVLKPKEVAKE